MKDKLYDLLAFAKHLRASGHKFELTPAQKIFAEAIKDGKVTITLRRPGVGHRFISDWEHAMVYAKMLPRGEE